MDKKSRETAELQTTIFFALYVYLQVAGLSHNSSTHWEERCVTIHTGLGRKDAVKTYFINICRI